MIAQIILIAANLEIIIVEILQNVLEIIFIFPIHLILKFLPVGLLATHMEFLINIRQLSPRLVLAFPCLPPLPLPHPLPLQHLSLLLVSSSLVLQIDLMMQR
jgi:hypothetical protein